MHYTFSAKNSTGIGLIEVMVATVVVAVGVLSVASFQGDLVSGSRGNKTRAEAKVLADTKIEQLRDTIEITGFNALTSSTAAESITGITETFGRSWVVTDQTNPDRKQISVTVCWLDGCPAATGNAGNQVKVQSIISFDNLGNSALAAKGNSGGGTPMNGPSLNAESSDEISETINLPSAQTPNTIYDAEDGKKYIVQNTGTKGTLAEICDDAVPALTPFENDLFTRRIDFDGISGKEAIELHEKVTISGEDFCIPRIRFNGGVIIPIRGIVHSGATTGNGHNQTLLDVNLFTFNTSESGTFCVFKPDSGAKSAPYVCYVGGNCAFGPDGSHRPDGTTANSGEDTIVTECPNPAVAAAKVGPGGWRGKMGLLGVAANDNNVCFAEEIAAAPATLDTARNYFTRNDANELNEGINKPYNCNDFLIINGQSTKARVHDECVIQKNAIGTLILASKNIRRDINGDNVFDPDIDTTYCSLTGTSYTITGAITNATSAPAVTVTDGVTTNGCSAITSGYSCQITTSADSISISGLYNNETKTCTVSPPSVSGCALNFTATDNPTYTIIGNIAGTSAVANAVSLTLSNGGTCVNQNNGTYSCTITTPATTPSVTLTAAISMVGATVTPVAPTTNPATINLSGLTATITGPNYTAAQAVTYTISGGISIGNHVSLASVTAAVVTGAGSCTLTGTHAENTSDSYSCSVTNGANDLTVSISPACSTGGGSKKYQMTDGTTTSLGTGTLVIHFNNITGNLTKNITITKSSTNC